MLGQTARIALFVLFILLLTLPLISGLQKTNPTTGQNVPWSEPAGAFGDVLDKQRREMISSQLGAIDLQPPGAVALVSFDYSTATQGEMQPLAEAMLSRLRGQGMRLILISLTPEGAALAQDTLDKILEKRGETYGAETVNLGYIPGEVIGIRELATGRQQLAQIADYEQGLTFAAPERAAWADVNNLAQVGLVVTLADNPATAQRWIEQLGTAIPATSGERYLLAATSAAADPFLRPYLTTQQLAGLISGINGAAALEATRKDFGPARQMLDSQSAAHLLLVILIAIGTMVGWMATTDKQTVTKAKGKRLGEK
jgi:CTP:molybdopterin cytidylyltransferase MocA